MNEIEFQKVAGGGEGLFVEFKRCGGEIERDTYESICAFANRYGGDLDRIGYADTLGSGVRKLFRYTPDYAGADPSFHEGDIFRITVPIKDEHIAWGTIPPLPDKTVEPMVAPTLTTSGAPFVATQVAPTVAPTVDLSSSPRFASILQAVEVERGTKELMELLKVGKREDLIHRYLTPLLSAGLIERTVPDKPTSRFQKYRLTPAGRAALASLPR